MFENIFFTNVTCSALRSLDASRLRILSIVENINNASILFYKQSDHYSQGGLNEIPFQKT